MAIKQANKFTDKNRPSGYYMVNGKRRFWSAENQKYYADQIGSTDDTLKRMGIPNPAAYLKGLIKGDPEKRRKADLMIAIGERGGRGQQLPADYRESELRAEAETRRSLGQSANIPLNENEVPIEPPNAAEQTEVRNFADENGEPVELPSGSGAMPETTALPQNTQQVQAAGKNPMHVWALANEKMILRNAQSGRRNNLRELQILQDAKKAQGREEELQINSAQSKFVKPQLKNELMTDRRTSYNPTLA